MRDEPMPERMNSENDINTSDLAEAGNRARAAYPAQPAYPAPPAYPTQPAAESAQARGTLITPAPEATEFVVASFPKTGQQEAERGPLFTGDETNSLHSEWNAIQGEFVDEPRRAVQDADQLVARTMTRLAEIFADERRNMERQWESGDSVSTEDLRLALRRYRSFFGRLLAV